MIRSRKSYNGSINSGLVFCRSLNCRLLLRAGSFARQQLVIGPSSKAASDRNFNSMKLLLDLMHYANFLINTATNH